MTTRMKTLGTLLLTMTIVGLSCPLVLAHDYWLSTENASVTTGEQVRVVLCSGHGFPKASTDTHGYLIHDAFVVGPEGNIEPIKATTNAEPHSATFRPSSNGTHLVCVSLTPPGKKEIGCWTSALVTVDNAGEASAPQTGDGMEIIIGAAPATLAVDSKLTISASYNARKIRALITVTREDGNISIMRSSPRRPAVLKIKKPGKYLIVASIAGKKCSLTFDVRNKQPHTIQK
jgi:hypothetical protein